MQVNRIGNAVTSNQRNVFNVSEPDLGNFQGSIVKRAVPCLQLEMSCCILRSNACGSSEKYAAGAFSAASCANSGVTLQGGFSRCEDEVNSVGAGGISNTPGLTVGSGPCHDSSDRPRPTGADASFCPAGVTSYAQVEAALQVAPAPVAVPTTTPPQSLPASTFLDALSSSLLMADAATTTSTTEGRTTSIDSPPKPSSSSGLPSPSISTPITHVKTTVIPAIIPSSTPVITPSTSMASSSSRSLRRSTNHGAEVTRGATHSLQEPLNDEYTPEKAATLYAHAQEIISTRGFSQPQVFALAQSSAPVAPVLAVAGGTVATATIIGASVSLVAVSVVLAGAIYFAYRAYKATSTRVFPELVEISVLENPDHDVVLTSSHTSNLEEIEVLARENIATTRSVLAAAQPKLRRSESLLSVEHLCAVSMAFKTNPNIRSRFDEDFDEQCNQIAQVYTAAELHVPDRESDSESEKGEVNPVVVQKLNEFFNNKEAAK